MGDEMKYSEGQRNQIYEKYLRPLKLKISQILLYDTNAAAVDCFNYLTIFRRIRIVGILKI